MPIPELHIAPALSRLCGIFFNNPKPRMMHENSPRKFTAELTLFVVMDIEKRTTYPMLGDMFCKSGQASNHPNISEGSCV